MGDASGALPQAPRSWQYAPAGIGRLVAEAIILSKDIGFVREGQEAALKLEA